MHRYLVIIEKAGANYSAYSPDLPGCVASGSTLEETETTMHEAIRFHLEGLLSEGRTPPAGQAIAEYMAV